MGRVCRHVLLFLAALISGWSNACAYAQPARSNPSEYDLKAVYLYNFLQFISWPAGKCSTNGKVDEIAVIGDSPIGKSLQNLQAELKRTQGINIQVRFYGAYTEGMDLSGCKLVFIAQSEAKHIRKILDAFKDGQAFTVADNEDCLDQGCMVSLFSQSDRVRWAVNRRSIENSGIKINARLLDMAMKVVK